MGFYINICCVEWKLRIENYYLFSSSELCYWRYTPTPLFPVHRSAAQSTAKTAHSIDFFDMKYEYFRYIHNNKIYI